MNAVSNILAEELERLQSEIITRHEAAGQVASGRTCASFDHTLTSDYSGQLLGASYSGVLERGRKPGKVPYDFREILLRWAAAKGISFSDKKQANTWAYFVTKKIREEGTELYRSGKTEDIFTTAVNDFSARLSERIGKCFQEKITNKIFTK